MKIEFTEQDLAVLDEALKVMPYYKVVVLINKINEQLTKQNVDVHNTNITDM